MAAVHKVPSMTSAKADGGIPRHTETTDTPTTVSHGIAQGTETDRALVTGSFNAAKQASSVPLLFSSYLV